MKWRAEFESLDPRKFEIEEDPVVGFYFYVFEDGKCIGDQLQDTLDVAIQSALDDYDVPKDAWRKVEK